MIVSFSGYNYTGTGAMQDLLKEYDEVCVLPRELMLIDLPDGIRDLDLHLNGRGTYFGGDFAIRRFRNFVEKLTSGKFRPNREAVRLTEEYTDRLTELTWRGKSVFDDTHLTGGQFVAWRLRHYGQIALNKAFHTKGHANQRTMRIARRMEEDEFLRLTQDYLQKLICTLGGREGKINAVNHLVPSCDPESLKYVPDGRLIMLARDPRDMYVLARKNQATRTVPYDDVRSFVTYFRRECTAHRRPCSEKELCVQFEDMIFDYENTVAKIESFLGLRRTGRRRTRFNPDVSIKNTQIYGRLPEMRADMDYIERELAGYLYPFPEKPRTSGDFF